MKYVIIGNSVAAVAAIEGIRSRDKTGEISVISGESLPCYGRPLISYYLLGRVKKENIWYRSADFYEKNGVKILNGRAVAIDAVKKTVALQSGEVVSYDRLLAATGSRPFIPPTEGLESVSDRFSFMTLADALALEEKLGAKKRVLIVGAGLIGLKCAEGILHRVKEVTVVDMADRILPSVLDGEGARLVQKYLEEKGVRFVLNDSVAKYEKNCATLAGGGKLSFDVLITAVGVRPETELVKAIGGKIGRGIIVDERMRTSVQDVFAAGDCAEGFDRSVLKNRVLALLPNAYFQGRCAGVNMAGGDASFTDGIPMNSVGFFDCHVATAGVYEGECLETSNGRSLKKLFVKDGKLVGFMLIGDIRRAGIYTALVKSGEPLGETDFAALAETPRLSAFSKERRRAILTRTV